jgi:predicted HTH transcriptional regulator
MVFCEFCDDTLLRATSVQVMLFRDRLEIWNPGRLPTSLTIEDLKKPHSSFPKNLLLAEPMYLAGYIERLGTGTNDMIKGCNDMGLKELEFVQEDVFKLTIWRNFQETGQVSGEASGEVKKVVLVIHKPMKRREIQSVLKLSHDDYFRVHYINPAIKSQVIELLYPDSLNHPKQKYKLTVKGIELQKQLEQEKINE